MIYSKLDWYSVVLNHYCPHEVLDLIDCYDDFISMARGREFDSETGFHTVVSFSMDGITFQIQKIEYDFLMDALDGDLVSLFDHEFNWLKLDLSGTGLDVLRNRGIPIDDKVSDPLFWFDHDEKQHHVTRADFAFDFVNLNPDFLPDFGFFLSEGEYKHWFDSGRMPNGRPGGLKYSNKLGGSEHTIYLGCPQSDKMLRCYDKLRQMAPDGIWKNPVPTVFLAHEDLPLKSWVRIELQTRREFADLCLENPWGLTDQIKNLEVRNQLLSVDDKFGFRWLPILSFIGDNFAPRDKNMRMIAGWDSLLPWADIKSLQKTGISRQIGDSRSDYKRAKDWVFDQVLTSLIALYCVEGPFGLLDLISDSLCKIYRNNDPVSRSRRNSIRRKILSGCHDKKISPSTIFEQLPSDPAAMLSGLYIDESEVKEVPLP